MLRLEKIEIAGFKSFADRISLVFGEGITGVVGPNGCGKSNIAEAISWVLGEQSPKNLRGAKMEDVIFNGTRDRKPSGMAEVILTLVATADITGHDDSQQESTIDYDRAVEEAEHAAALAGSALAKEQTVERITADEPTPPAEPLSPDSSPDRSMDSSSQSRHATVSYKRRKRKAVVMTAGERITVGRRLYRTGDSDYLMNGRACLLRDVQDLFAGTGLGGAHYAIIEQGRIGQILSSKPLDRRGLIEEAAGITKFKSRKRATELKLESAKQNLSRLNDIITEVERQVNSLKRQAQKARRYRRLREEMRTLQKRVFVADYYRLTAAASALAKDFEAALATQNQADARLGEREIERRAASSEARLAEDSLVALRERSAEAEREADRLRSRLSFDELQFKELTARIDEIEREQRALTERLALLETEAARRGSDLTSLEAEVNLAQASMLERESEYQARLSALREVEDEIERLRQQVLADIGTTERLRNAAANLEESLRRVDLRQVSLQAETSRAATRLADASSQHAAAKVELESDLSRVEDLKRRLADQAAEMDQSRAEVATVQSQLEGLRARGTAAEQRLASLEDLDAHHAYYSDAVQHVLSSEVSSRINALGTLADFVDVEPRFERLVENLFGRELQCVLVPTIDDALAGLESLRSESLGRGAFLVIGLHGAEGDYDRDSDLFKDEGVREGGSVYPADGDPGPVSRFQLDVLSAVELLGLRPEIKAVVERAFPDKSAASVVPDIEAALHLSLENQSRIYVTYDGEQVVNGRLIVSGAPTGQQATSLLGLKREIRQLRSQADELKAMEQPAAASLDVAAGRLREIESEAAALDSDLREHEKKSASNATQLDGLARDLERAEQHVRVVQLELTQSSEERAELELRIEQVRLELEAAEHSREEGQQRLAHLQLRHSEARSDCEALGEELSTARASLAARSERLAGARGELRRMESELEEFRSRINRNRLELYESHNRAEQLTAARVEAQTALSEYESQREQTAGDVSAAAEAVTTERMRVDQLETELATLRQAADEARSGRSSLEVERARMESEAGHLSRSCFSELTMSLEDVVTSVELGQAAGDPARGLVESSEQDGTGDEFGEPGSLETGESDRARLDQLRTKIEDIGPVNMMALEELEEADGRYRFLSEQRADILNSIKATEEALAEIKRRSRERFKQAFAEINSNFQRMFLELFGGGRGEMMLIDEDDVLESGIDVIAQPPGKRLQNVLLLSGGEKAMAAIALVLAIFQYRPSPFCVLDEVDAPLDEVNVARFADKIAEMGRDTQFLVITHNKRTMESGRALYGVTMEERGVSKLVSVKFE
jgi:chromosome segregation protein